jgi:hypothetical protein
MICDLLYNEFIDELYEFNGPETSNLEILNLMDKLDDMDFVNEVNANGDGSCYILYLNSSDFLFFWLPDSSNYTEKISEAGIYDLDTFQKKRPGIPYINSIEKYQNIDRSRTHSIIIPVNFLRLIGYVDRTIKKKDIKHPLSKIDA